MLAAEAGLQLLVDCRVVSTTLATVVALKLDPDRSRTGSLPGTSMLEIRQLAVAECRRSEVRKLSW